MWLHVRSSMQLIDLPFDVVTRSLQAMGRVADRKRQLSGIQTLQSWSCRLHRSVLQPSNDGYTRNPVRPSVNPNFTGEISQGDPTGIQSRRFVAAAAGDLWPRGAQHFAGPRSGTDLVPDPDVPFSDR